MTKDLIARPVVDRQTFHTSSLVQYIMGNFDNFLELLDISLQKRYNYYVGECPVHGGNNPTALNIYEDSGGWQCYTHHCEQHFGRNLTGFIRGILSHRKYGWSGSPIDKMAPYDDVLAILKQFTNNSDLLSNIKKSLHVDQQSFIKQTQIFTNGKAYTGKIAPRSQVRNLLQIPSPYYLDRGFSEQILQKYDVGTCVNPDKKLYNRAVVPIYDENNEYLVGATGRSIFEKCLTCKQYHDSTVNCPEKYSPKWLHTRNFPRKHILYNFGHAKEYIEQSNTIIIVESPGNLWRLEESGIHNAVAILGTSLSQHQLYVINRLHIMNIITIMDNDENEAGKNGQLLIDKMCRNLYKVRHINLVDVNDVAEFTIADVKYELLPQLI